jgi:NitT/TauT family transport system substrate-binding protein
MRNHRLLAGAFLIGGLAVAHAEDAVRIGEVRSIGSGATLTAVERGYFKEQGIKVEIDGIDSSANAFALLAQNRYQIVEGGLSAGYFNALEKNLPIIAVVDRASSPLAHNLMIRADLKDTIKSIKDLKGRTIASNGPGSISTYEIDKILQKGGLGLADVEIKVLPFTQMGLALNNKAVDAALAIPPFTHQIRNPGFGVMFADPDDYVVPAPTALSVNTVNTEWAKQNPDLVRRYYLAYMRGVRDYCQAYHGGSNRKEMIDLLVRSGTERRPEMLNEYVWPARDPLGGINIASALDIAAWYVKNKFAGAVPSADRLADLSYIEYVNSKLGPFVLENKASTLKGCR